MTRLALLLLGLAVTPLVLAAQANAPRFEVASVKPNKEADASGGMRVTPERLTAMANLLIDVIRNAYQIDYVRIVGAPDWTNKERFDISATVPPNSTPQQIGAMMQSLLADRFAFKALEKRARSGFTFSRRRVRMAVSGPVFGRQRSIARTLGRRVANVISPEASITQSVLVGRQVSSWGNYG